MLKLFDGLRNLTELSTAVRLILSFICGTVIGLERSYRNKPAGFRTHTLVCLAACIASMTGMYLYLVAGLSTDISRIGAQVISGLGFIGAGTIVVTRSQKVKGLTTAAGMWTAGIIGLSIGAGFYEGGIAATLMVLFIETAMNEVRKRIRFPQEFRIVLSYYSRSDLDQVLRFCKDSSLTITNLQITGNSDLEKPVYSAMLSLRSHKDVQPRELSRKIESMPGIISAEEI